MLKIKRKTMRLFIKNILLKLSCLHEWELRRRVYTYEDESCKYPYKCEILYVCRKCGKFKKIKV